MISDAEYQEIERWADDHFSQGEVAVVMRLVSEYGWRPPVSRNPHPVCTDPDCTIPRKPGFPMHGPHDFRASR